MLLAACFLKEVCTCTRKQCPAQLVHLKGWVAGASAEERALHELPMHAVDEGSGLVALPWPGGYRGDLVVTSAADAEAWSGLEDGCKPV